MNFGIKFRLIALGSAVGLMGALIVLITLYSQRQAAALHTRLSQLESESISISEYFKDTLRDVNDKILHYESVRDETGWKKFLIESGQLKQWIDAQKSNLNTQRESDTLKQIDIAYDDYLHSVQDLRARIQAVDLQASRPVSSTDSLAQPRRRLFDLGQDLAREHFDLRNQLLANANRTLFQLRLSVLGLLALLFTFGIALVVIAYREMVVPLRVKLVESQALAERREKLASLGLLAAGVAHEIRNPLTAVQAVLFIQKKQFQPGSLERNRVEMVEREMERLERIVNDFLQFARPAEPELATVTADSILTEAQQLLAPQLEKNNIQLKFEPSEPMRIRVDVAQCKQVLLNLIQNAADSIGRNGQIILRARSDRKRLADGEVPVVVIEVADTGKGIPPEVEKRLFDPFFTTKENGTGLGLSIAAQIVQKQGGQLQYQTLANRGTTFGIVLPKIWQ